MNTAQSCGIRSCRCEIRSSEHESIMLSDIVTSQDNVYFRVNFDKFNIHIRNAVRITLLDVILVDK
jgi:hypothetical protein